MDFVKFLTDYWQYLVAGIAIILDVVLIIIKKRPRGVDALNEAICHAVQKLPYFIKCAEDIYLTLDDGEKHGLEKKDQVISWAYEFISNFLHREPNSHEELYIYQALSYFVESILDTPQKKGEDEQ